MGGALRWTPITLLLVGCPYVFGGPDLSNVDRSSDTDTDADTDADTDTDTDADSDTDSDADADTSDTGPLGSPPEVTELKLLPRSDGALVLFTGVDADDDLEGGELRISDGDTTQIFMIPDDLLAWTPGGESALLWEVPTACDGFDLDLEVSATDAAGHAGLPATAGLVLQGFGEAPEVGFGPVDVGPLTPPTLLCATSDMFGDQDRFQFHWPGGQVVAFLTWDTAADIDLYLEDTNLNWIAGSETVTPTELIDRQLSQGSYVWSINHFGGSVPTIWTLLVEQQ